MADNLQRKCGKTVIRLACYSDADQLAKVHHLCSANQPGGFMSKLGLAFFKQYYRILLKEPATIILCAVDEEGVIVGISTGTLDARREKEALRTGRYRLLLWTLPTLLRRPLLLKDVYERMKVLSSSSSEEGPPQDGARFSYWGYLPSQPSKESAIRLQMTFLNIMEDLGVDRVSFEIDAINQKVLKISKLMGGEITKTIRLKDGRERLVGFHQLSPKIRTQIRIRRV